ncbi:MAG: L-threonylcarbamoyladenylate synthase, partial [Candidatus Levybacteria bacterium]|nr:L-threonylcarbamoyladenylate synthase [Candidatus Levybacteria bacterium]
MDNINKAIKILKEGGIIIFPTDTAFAIGCRIDNEKAVERLFKIRKRPQNQAVPVLVDTVKMAQDFLVSIPKEVIDKLVEPYWPGALTIILPCKTDKVPYLVRGLGQTLGVRIPNHPIARKIIREVGVPILGPSANFHGEKTPYKFKDLNSELKKLV